MGQVGRRWTRFHCGGAENLLLVFGSKNLVANFPACDRDHAIMAGPYVIHKLLASMLASSTSMHTLLARGWNWGMGSAG
jgi:hypothetical protein